MGPDAEFEAFMNQAEVVRQFAQELTAIQRQLFMYITTLVNVPADADDVLQEVNRVIWEKFEEFRPGTNFAAWAYKIAYYEVLTFRKRKAREKLQFKDETLELLARDATQLLSDESAQRLALRGCLEKLPDADRELISQRYLSDTDMHAMAEQLGRSEKSLYRSLARIRSMLLECIQRTMAAEALS